MKQLKEEIKPITLSIDPELWEKFKNKVPRTITLNQAIVKLINEEVNRDTK